MKKPPSCFLLIGFIPLLVAGCATRSTVEVEEVIVATPYARVVVADFRANPLAEYIAEGSVRPTDEGYRFQAVERRIFQPRLMVFRYPLGRPVTVTGSNVVITPAAKPTWLLRADGE